MKQRCYNSHNKRYKYYGGRGVKVCDKWSIEHGYDDNLTIDRIDNDGNYEPNNCRWTTMKQQCINRRTSKNITTNGETHCLKEWCEILNIKYVTVKARLNRYYWSIEKALEITS